MNIVEVNINDIKPYENNAKKHDKTQIANVAESIKRYGFIQPCVIDKDNVLVIGHCRLLGAKKLKLKTVPCVYVDTLTDDEVKALRLLDNKLNESDWDMDLLSVDIEGLDFSGFDIDWGLPEDEEEKEIIEDEVPEVDEEAEPICKLGDIWQLGEHKLMCGDSTDKAMIERLLNGEKADMVFADPPYGMSAVSKSGVLSKKYKTDIMNDDTNDVAINGFLLCKELFKDIKQIWWGANYYTECLPSAECWLVWDKNNGGSDQTDCELAWTNFRSVVRQFTLASEKSNRVHPTQKPVKLIQQILNKFDKRNDIKTIVDLFGGGGSTLIACEQLNRKCFILELDERYCDVIIKRWEQFTGKKAVKIND